MPTNWSGTIEERIARLEQAGRRCDGNSAFCTRAAVRRFELVRADGQGVAIPGEPVVEKKACSFHRKQFEANGQWVVLFAANLGIKTGGPRRKTK